MSRTTDANAQSSKALSAQRSDDRLYPLVAAAPPPGAQTNPPKRQVEIVMDDQDLLWRYLVPFGDWADGLAALIHEGEWLGQDYAMAPNATFAQQGFEPLLAEAYPADPRQLIDALEPYVVAVSGVSPARVPQPDDELAGRSRPALTTYGVTDTVQHSQHQQSHSVTAGGANLRE